jgi:hypothetical protein
MDTNAISITIDPEIRDLIWPLTPAEDALLDFQLPQAGRARDPLVVWHDTASGKHILLDGHNRLRICRKHGLKYDVVVAEDVLSRADALAFVERTQLGRRNTSRHQWAYLVGGRYLRERMQGARSDLYSGKPQSTAERIGTEFGVSGRAIESCGSFRTAMDRLRATLSVDAIDSILTQEARISREEVIQLSSFEDSETIQEIWDEWVRTGRAGMARIIAKHKTAKKPSGTKERVPATDRYSFADLIRLIAMNWSPEAVAKAIETGALTPAQQGVMHQHLGTALRNMIGIADETGYGQDALDEWLDRQEAAAAVPEHDDDAPDAQPEDAFEEQALLPAPTDAAERLCKVEGCDTVPEYSGRGRRSDFCLGHRKPSARDGLALRS